MKQFSWIFLILSIVLATCQSQPKVITEGTITYAIDYPNHKDNFFLYSILPKSMDVRFKNGHVESIIQKANLTNALFVDCNKKQFAAYFEYGDEAFRVKLNETDIQTMLNNQKRYRIQLLPNRDTLAGFNVKKALAIAVNNPEDVIELWYTNEVKIKNSNWYNPYYKVPGFLLAYSIDRYGIRMEFKAKRLDETKLKESQLKLPKNGTEIVYSEYNERLSDLFKSFE